MANWIDAIERGELRLPTFQRGWVWSDAQILALLDSLFQGYHVGSMLIWERYDLPAATVRFGEVEVACPEGRGAVVVDGQQRLSAIVTAARSGRFWFDLDAGVFTTAGAGPWRVPLRDIIGFGGWVDGQEWTVAHAAEHGIDPLRLKDAWLSACGVLDRAMMSAVLLPSSWPLAMVVESYRRMAVEGTPMDPDEVAAALARFEAEQAP